MSLWVCNVKVISIAEAAMEITSALQAYDDISTGSTYLSREFGENTAVSFCFDFLPRPSKKHKKIPFL